MKEVLMEMAKNPANWMTGPELKDFRSSGLEMAVWIKRKFGMSPEEFIEMKKSSVILNTAVVRPMRLSGRERTGSKETKVKSKVEKKISENLSLGKDSNEPELREVLKLRALGSFEVSSIGARIVIVSRELRTTQEVDQHRFHGCDHFDTCLNEAVQYLSKNSGGSSRSFSCCQCKVFLENIDRAV